MLLFTECRETQAGQVRQVRPYSFLTQFIFHLDFPPDGVRNKNLICLCFPHNLLFHLNILQGVPFKHTDITLSLLCRSEKKAEGPDEKELKKKEKQRLEKEKKELKEKQEKEKKEQREKEKKENEMKKKFKVSAVVLTEQGGMAGVRAAGEGGVCVLAYKPVGIHSSWWKSRAEHHEQAQMECLNIVSFFFYDRQYIVCSLLCNVLLPYSHNNFLQDLVGPAYVRKL